jgi:diaminohydroxyphosphoribosylaminopyrimidine deaminase / 5-amino-6-(5-phosphoribosylamino)uracil reductase
MSFSKQDKYYMSLAIKLAACMRGWTSPDPLVGSVIVKNNRIVATGFHGKHKTPHAEAYALDRAGERANGATAYVTLEPCCHHGNNPPCSEKLIRAGVKRVVIASLDPNPLVKSCNSLLQLQEAGIKIEHGCLEKEATVLNEVFFSHITNNRPFTHLKVALTLDGKTATKTGDSKWISSQESRNYAHYLRYIYDGIMVGADTVIKDDPELTVRTPAPKIHRQRQKQPIKVLIDSNLRIPLDSKCLQNSENRVFIYTTQNPADNYKKSLPSNVHIYIVNEKEGHVDLEEVMQHLYKHNISSLLVESGGALSSALIKAQLLDKVSLVYAPRIIGGQEAHSAIGDLGIDEVKQSYKLKNISTKTIGADILVEGYLTP